MSWQQQRSFQWLNTYLVPSASFGAMPASFTYTLTTTHNPACVISNVKSTNFVDFIVIKAEVLKLISHVRCKLDTLPHILKWLKFRKREENIEVSCQEVVVAGTHKYDLLKWKVIQIFLENILTVSYKHNLPCSPVITALSVYPREMKAYCQTHEHTHIHA